MADLRDLLYTRAFSDVLCRCSEFCLASTWKTVARTGAGRREAAWRHGNDHYDHSLEGQAGVGVGGTGRRADGTCEQRGPPHAGAEAEGAAAAAGAGWWSSHVAGVRR